MHSPNHRSSNQNKLSALTKVRSVDNFHSKKIQKPLEHLLHANDYSVTAQKLTSINRNFPILGHCRSGSSNQIEYQAERQSVHNDQHIFSVKSIDTNGNFQKLINHYKQQNQNLKKQNKYLIGELKEYKKRDKNSQHQLQKMEYLQQKLQKLEAKNAFECKCEYKNSESANNRYDRTPKNSSKKQFIDYQLNSKNKHSHLFTTNQKGKTFNESFINENQNRCGRNTQKNNLQTLRVYNSPGKDTYYNKFYGQQIRKQPNFSQQPHICKYGNSKQKTSNEDMAVYLNSKKQESNLTFQSSTADDIKDKIGELNNEFNLLIEQCARERDGLRKLDLRRSLAIVAKQMKTLKQQFQKSQKHDF